MKKAIALNMLCTILLLAFFGCRTATGEGFAIYLTAGNVPVSQMPALSHVELVDEPIISTADIMSYSQSTHEIQLSKDAYQRIQQLQVPTNGTSFMACVDRNPIYWGAFWIPISSQSFNGITIMKELGKAETVITIERGYPSSDFASGEDPRSDKRIFDSLKQAGKLAD